MTDTKAQTGPAEPAEELSRYLPSSAAPLSEDANAGLAAPVMDLIAGVVVAAIAVWFTIESLRLPLPGKVITAPGLLPILVSVSLLGMAMVLLAGAWSRYRAGDTAVSLPPGVGRTAVLALLLAAYVAGLQFVPVRYAFSVADIRFVLGSFELVSVVALTAILSIYWRKPLWTCLIVTIVWTAILSVIFRNIFHIQLP